MDEFYNNREQESLFGHMPRLELECFWVASGPCPWWLLLFPWAPPPFFFFSSPNRLGCHRRNGSHSLYLLQTRSSSFSSASTAPTLMIRWVCGPSRSWVPANSTLGLQRLLRHWYDQLECDVWLQSTRLHSPPGVMCHWCTCFAWQRGDLLTNNEKVSWETALLWIPQDSSRLSIASRWCAIISIISVDF